MTLGKLPLRRHVQHDPSLFQLLHVELEPVMVKRDQHVHLRLGAADPLIRNIQLIARVAALYELGIFAIPPQTHEQLTAIPAFTLSSSPQNSHTMGRGKRTIGKPALLSIVQHHHRPQARSDQNLARLCNSIPFTSCEAPNSNVKLPHAVSKG